MSKLGDTLIDALNEAAELSEIIEVVAEVWSSIDGKDDLFRKEKRNQFDIDLGSTNTGTYAGYRVEALELLKRLNRRGLTINRFKLTDSRFH